MTRNPKPAYSPKKSHQKFLEIYEKMLKDSRSLAVEMADSIKRDSRKVVGKAS